MKTVFLFFSHISREKTLELLVELWESDDPHDHGGQEAASKRENDECCESDPSCCCISGKCNICRINICMIMVVEFHSD